MSDKGNHPMTQWGLIWNIFIFCATGYVIFGLHQSAWWIVLPLAISVWPDCECGDDDE